MKVYFAGTTGIVPREKMVINKAKARLISFYYIDKGLAVKEGFNYILKKKKNEKRINSSSSFRKKS